jgi:hypothetical protein
LEPARERQVDHPPRLARWPGIRPGNRLHGQFVIPLVLLTLACGYLLSYVFRIINGSIADELIQQFSLAAGSIGLLTSVYFLAFAVSAIPISIALDAFGPLLVQGCLMSIAAVVRRSSPWHQARSPCLAGRALIGLGVARGRWLGSRHTHYGFRRAICRWQKAAS